MQAGVRAASQRVCVRVVGRAGDLVNPIAGDAACHRSRFRWRGSRDSRASTLRFRVAASASTSMLQRIRCVELAPAKLFAISERMYADIE